MRRASWTAARSVRWLTRAATVLVLVQGVCLDGYLLFLAPFYLCICLFLMVGAAKLVQWWERAWSAPGNSLAPIAVLLSVASASSLYLASLATEWGARGNGPIVTSIVLAASAAGVMAHASLGPRFRWILLAAFSLLIGTATWIEIDRWWVTAVVAGYKGGTAAFVDQIIWAWPPHRISILLGLIAPLMLLQWLVHSRSGPGKPSRPELGTAVSCDNVPK